MSKPDKDVAFYRKGKKIKKSDKYKIESDGCVHRLIISDCTLDEAADFTAKLRDDETTTANLTVEGELPV